MKNIILTLLIGVLASQGIAQQTNFDNKYLKADKMYHFDDKLKLTRATIFATYKAEFGLGLNDEMISERTIVEGNKTYTKFLQFHKGYAVENYMMNANGQNGVILTLNGNIAKGLNVDVQNIISESEALAIALTRIGAQKYSWQDAERENNIKEETENPLITSYPKGKLIIVQKSGSASNEFTLAYKFIIQALEPSSTNTVYIDAKNASLIYNLNTEDDYSHNNSGTGWTWYNGQFNNLGTGHCGTCTKFRLNSNKNIMTFEHPTGNTYPDNNNNWVENSYYGFDQRKSAHSAHWSAERTWDFYLNHFGRWGSNYTGNELRVWMRADPIVASFSIDGNGIDAIKVRSDANDGTQAPSSTNQGIGFSKASFDVIAHEYTHAMIRRSSALVNYGESGALNEGFADIFSIMAERNVFGTFNWAFGENIGVVRRFDNPNQDFLMGNLFTTVIPNPAPAMWGQNSPYWWTPSPWFFPQNPLPAGSTDDTKHKNSGVLRKWFWLLAVGDTYNGITVPGIGVDKAERIAYNTFNWYIWSTSHYIDAVNGSIQATIDLYGNCSPEHKAVARAWRAVTNNTPLPNCLLLELDGPNVIQLADLSTNPAIFKTRFDREGLNPTNIEWKIPSGWNVSISGSELKLLNTTNTNSQELIANYVDGNNVISGKIMVHFTDEVVIGDNNLPSSKFEESELITSNQNFTVYPNPASDKIQIILPNNLESANYQLLDINGRVLLSGLIHQQSTEINTSSISNGLYFLQVKSASYSQVQKINIKN